MIIENGYRSGRLTVIKFDGYKGRNNNRPP